MTTSKPAANNGQPVDVPGAGAMPAVSNAAGDVLARVHAILFAIGQRRAAGEQRPDNVNVPMKGKGEE